mmetsp:Transcript_23132/g.55770  ORF Transcript_23132/g.55770 Transcript_23132/m.55770 type:complete len:194 (+) Transcript_23132:56-637(+)
MSARSGDAAVPPRRRGVRLHLCAARTAASYRSTVAVTFSSHAIATATLAIATSLLAAPVTTAVATPSITIPNPGCHRRFTCALSPASHASTSLAIPTSTTSLSSATLASTSLAISASSKSFASTSFAESLAPTSFVKSLASTSITNFLAAAYLDHLRTIFATGGPEMDGRVVQLKPGQTGKSGSLRVILHHTW